VAAGARRRPVLTAAVAGVTVAVSVAGLVAPGLRGDLARVPGEWADGARWRLGTSLLVHDGWAALAGNTLLLIVVGAAAEARWSRPAWAGLYLAGGLAGEVAGLHWQPHGAGNSVAVFGLAGGLAALAAADPGDAGLALPLGLGIAWAVALVAADLGGRAPTVGAALVAAGGSLAVRQAQRGPLPPAAVGAAAAALAAGGAVLTGLDDIHGPAILAGLALSVPAAARRRRRGGPPRGPATPPPPGSRAR
jgi:membrane associated rhomboid family serine protease